MTQTDTFNSSDLEFNETMPDLIFSEESEFNNSSSAVPQSDLLSSNGSEPVPLTDMNLAIHLSPQTWILSMCMLIVVIFNTNYKYPSC